MNPLFFLRRNFHGRAFAVYRDLKIGHAALHADVEMAIAEADINPDDLG